LLDDKSIDAVVVATPDHWHARMVIDAVEAGKDVYVEKPLAHKIDEGFQVIDAVRRTCRVVQVGTQRRSATMFLEAKRIMETVPDSSGSRFP
jgi:predicted dehydrogenase